MAKIDGNKFRIKMGGVTLAATNDVDFTLTKDVQDTTTQDSAGWKERHPTAGVREITGSFKGWTVQDDLLLAATGRRWVRSGSV